MAATELLGALLKLRLLDVPGRRELLPMNDGEKVEGERTDFGVHIAVLINSVITLTSQTAMAVNPRIDKGRAPNFIVLKAGHEWDNWIASNKTRTRKRCKRQMKIVACW